MTRLASCPAWCAAKHEADDPYPLHSTAIAELAAGRAKSGLGRVLLPTIAVGIVLASTATGDEPRVSVHAVRGDAGLAWVRSRDAVALAAVIDRLAAATPAQHRELAAAIRQAAGLIAGEVA
jgi:hypothetical protein